MQEKRCECTKAMRPYQGQTRGRKRREMTVFCPMSALMWSRVPGRITFSGRCQAGPEGRARASYTASCSHMPHERTPYTWGPSSAHICQKPFTKALPQSSRTRCSSLAHAATRLLRVCGRSTAPRPQVPRFAPFRRFSEHDYSPSSRLKNDACTGFYGVSDEVTPPVGRAVKHRFSQMSATARNGTNQ